MTTSPEEQALFADASQVKLERQQLNPADTAFAIQRGLAKARTRRMTGHVQLKWITAVLVTALAAGWLLMGPLGSTPQQAMYSPPAQNWGVLEPFRELAGKEVDGNTISSAINNGYVQLVNRSVKSGIYQLTVNAVMADENKMIVLYTAQTDASQEIYSVPKTNVVNGMTNQSLGYSGISSLYTPNGKYTLYGRSTVEMDGNTPLPDQVKFDFRISSVVPDLLADTNKVKKDPKYQFSKPMEVSFDLDPKFSVPKTEKIKLNQLFTIGGHEVLLSEAEVSPLMTRVRFIYEPNQKIDYKTKLSVSDVVNPIEIVSTTKDGQKTKLSGVSGNGTEDGMVYSFSSNLLDGPQSLVLKLRGEPGKVYDDWQEAEKHMLELRIK
ncbi:DUF4179 domain-containing protein [Paenibacillus taichungensis]|uniref:DUF4179 domain-containing protein n=1 Tax=Paenibacillus TaxID=44249 RepID=UPI000C196BE3|nr:MULTISPECIES: DUF4179 domain-containing protein [Paenibacillus]MEC0108585.1 DUF4179 domain-containing protein [Paenibacillus taichungensis]MEC0196085.1 DUF4179 domain-containing protein [Paenibacillus taichungensis]PIH58657.1 hypothetical protein CS562_16180 [Paenibacillus sp. LK1]